MFGAPVSNRHGPLPQPRTQQGELRLVVLYSRDRAGGRGQGRGRTGETIKGREAPGRGREARQPRIRSEGTKETDPHLSALLHSPPPSLPALSVPPPPPLTLTPLRYLTYLRASCHPTVGTIFPGLVDPSDARVSFRADEGPTQAGPESRVKGNEVRDYDERVRAVAQQRR